MRPIPGYEGKYFACENGRIWSAPRMKKNRGKMVPLVGKYLSLQLNSGGYPVVRPSLEGKLRTIAAHRLIAMAFLPNPNNYKCVNHKNGIKTDNRVEKLGVVHS